MLYFDQEEKEKNSMACIKVVGVGGAGGNTLNCMIESGFEGASFYAVNTDAQALKMSLAPNKIQIGLKSTKGLGAGANPETGKRAAEEDLDKIMEALGAADIVFVTGGMGGGTGSGAIPVLVQALKEKGILTIVVVTKPFNFEGKRRARITQEALDSIKSVADTLIIIPNQKLLDVADQTVSMIDGFGMINEVLNQSVRGISEIITRPGHINVDFADVREIMKDKGLAVMGTARASGAGRAKKAALDAISSPLLETMSIAGARAVLLNITGGKDLGLHEMSEAASVIYEQADEDANIILGSVIDSTMGDEVLVTVIATGFAVMPTAKPVQEAYPVSPACPLPPMRPKQAQEAVAMPTSCPLPAQHHVAEAPKVTVTPQAAYYEPVKVAHERVQPAPAVIVSPVAEQAVKTAQEDSSVIYVVPFQDEQVVAVVETPVKFDQEVAALAAAQQLSEEEQFAQLVREEEALRALQVAKAAQIESMQGAMYAQQACEHEKETSVETTNSSHTIDIHDLDVPAFMRRQVKEKQRTE